MDSSTGLVCARHGTPTRLTCTEVTCGTPICPKCAMKSPVGFRCPEHGPAGGGRRRRSRRALVVLAVLALVAGAVYVRRATREEPFQAVCPTRAGPDVGLGNTARGTNWTELADAPICGRFGASSVWTGKELVVWGGQNCAGAECPGEQAPRLADGAAYDPARNRWRRLAASPLGPRDVAATVWTGTEMLIWGGGNFGAGLADGAAYNPATDRWRPLAFTPLAGRGEAAAQWTGTEMLVWSGVDHADGAAYDPATDTWRPMANAPVNGRAGAASVWTGKELLVWGGTAPRQEGGLTDGAAYDPAADTWRRLPSVRLGSRSLPAAVWTGQEMLIWGGDFGGVELFGDGAAYNPATDTWRALPSSPITPRGAVLGVWSGGEMIVWGGLGRAGDAGAAPALSGPRGRPFDPAGIVPLGDGAAYNPTSNGWRRLQRVELLERGYALGAWDGAGMIVWGGLVIVDSPASAADGARYTA